MSLEIMMKKRIEEGRVLTKQWSEYSEEEKRSEIHNRILQTCIIVLGVFAFLIVFYLSYFDWRNESIAFLNEKLVVFIILLMSILMVLSVIMQILIIKKIKQYE